MGQLVRCAYCRGSGDDRHKDKPCSACGGSGQIMIPYDNYVTCSYCRGSGDDRHLDQPCRACHGAGVIAPGIQIP
jgi:DnaJ-class molecular chaperone